MGRCKLADQREHCSLAVSKCENMGRSEVDVLNWGVTVVREVRKVRKQKMAKELERQSPSLDSTVIDQFRPDS